MDSLLEIEKVLDRQTPVGALDALILALGTTARETKALSETAIVLDSSAFLRLATHKQSADIIDYLTSSQHRAPLIIPGQSIQEFWNNQLSVVDTMASSLQKKYDVLKNEASKISASVDKGLSEIGSLLEKFKEEHGYRYDENTARLTLSLLQKLKKKAIVPYAPRLRFTQLGAVRKQTKTPPGFRDDGDGDFFIWIDSLFGLSNAKREGVAFTALALVTEDRKDDWSRNGVPHPVLTAEVGTLFGASFCIWTLEELNAAVRKAISPPANTPPESSTLPQTPPIPAEAGPQPIAPPLPPAHAGHSKGVMG